MKLIDDIRRDNIALLISELGSLVSLANRLERDSSQVSQWLNGAAHSATGKKRGLRPSSARYIEEKCGKPIGWLDVQHDESSQGKHQAMGNGVSATPQGGQANLGQGRLARLKGIASPRSLAILERLESSIVRGSLTEDDLALLEQTAAHIEKVRPTKD